MLPPSHTWTLIIPPKLTVLLLSHIHSHRPCWFSLLSYRQMTMPLKHMIKSALVHHWNALRPHFHFGWRIFSKVTLLQPPPPPALALCLTPLASVVSSDNCPPSITLSETEAPPAQCTYTPQSKRLTSTPISPFTSPSVREEDQTQVVFNLVIKEINLLTFN